MREVQSRSRRRVIPSWWAMVLSVFVLGQGAFAQDTLSVMTYNLLNFPSVSPNRVDTLEKIVQYFQPDILLVNELKSNIGANSILTGALNVNGITTYQKAVYVTSGSSDVLLFYNSAKLVLKAQFHISTSLRDIGQYILYYKTPDLGTNPDTTFIYAYSLHLKAGDMPSDENQRLDEATSFISHIGSLPSAENLIVGGDYNIYKSSESAYTKLLETSPYTLEDPISRPGVWQANSSFADIHTQSSRVSSLDGGAGGGMDDRFDFFLVSADVMDGSHGVHYIPGTYEAIGQDGNRYNGTILSPANTTYPYEIISALYYMSDHLPVLMKLFMGQIASVNELVADQGKVLIRVAPGGRQLIVDVDENSEYSTAEVYTSNGDLIATSPLSRSKSYIDLNVSQGMLIVRLIGKQKVMAEKIMLVR